MANKLVLQIEGLTVSFDGFKAVDNLNFYLEPDALHCVIGPNGAGKTTLLDMICGKTKPTAGKIYFKDTDITELMEYQITVWASAVNSRRHRCTTSLPFWRILRFHIRAREVYLVRYFFRAQKLSHEKFTRLPRRSF